MRWSIRREVLTYLAADLRRDVATVFHGMPDAAAGSCLVALGDER